MKTNTKVPKTPFFAAFSVGAVLFSAHAGGGFATGNQANTYYVGLGWTGIISAIVAMLLLTLTMREAMIMYNSRGLTSYKQLFETLYHPFDKIEWAFEVFFYIMVLMAVAAAISGAYPCPQYSGSSRHPISTPGAKSASKSKRCSPTNPTKCPPVRSRTAKSP